MHITQLEIDNFKSFGKKTRIPFFEGFTVISGPNGSGKSNIIDSILFVLALSSARGLRAEKLTDLINVNTGKNTAEVGILFSDGTAIRRRIKRTASGYYSYNYLNDRLCKQSDVVEFLKKYGVKPEGYNVVMQGDITRIMEMSDVERRKIIDEIAGVAEFDQKRGQALSELEVVRERIEREEVILHELNARLEELGREREQALLYQKWQEELGQLRHCRSAALLRQKMQDLATVQGLLQEQRDALERTGVERGNREAELEQVRGCQKEIEDRIAEKSGSEYLQLIEQLEEAKGGIKLAEKSILRLKSEKESNLELMKRIYMDTRRAEARVAECVELLRNLGIDRANLAMEVSAGREELAGIDAKIQAGSREVQGLKDQLFGRMEELEQKKERRSALLHEQDLLIEKSRMRSSERERLDARLRQVEEELVNKADQLAECSAALTDCEAEKQRIEREISEAEGQLFAKRSALERLKKEIRSREQDIMRLEAQQQAGGDAGGRAMEAVLAMDGVHGTIAQLGRAPPKYATALDVAAGGRLRYVVVDDDARASDAIRFLKEQRLGRITFLPLNKIRPPELSPLSDQEVIGYAVDLLDFDPEFERAFRLVFGATVVVDTLERARRMMGRYRMVTLEGDLLERGGAMTGGHPQKKVRGFGIALDDELARLRQSLAELEAEARDIEAAVQRSAAYAEETRAKRSAVDEQMARHRMLIDEYQKRIDVLSEEKQTLLQALDAIQAGTKAGGEELERLETGLQQVAAEIADVSGEIEALKKKLDDTEIPALTEEFERCKKEVDEAERRLRNKDADIADAKRERQHFANRIEELNAERDRADAKNQEIDAEIIAHEKQIEENRLTITGLEERQKEFSQELDALRTERDQIVERLHGLEREIVELEGAAGRIRMQIEALTDRENALLQELAELRDQAGEAETDLELGEIDERIEKAERALRRIGAVNMLAIEEHERVMKRMEERTSKKDVLSRERTLIIERIEKFEKMKYDAFMSAFTAIDTNFRDIFARLTDGSGRLVLESEENPFAGGMTFAVQPRDKKVHLLSSLSGGEKSIVTLAFIFAIQNYMPAPFYALDEVDMFLDGSNVERVAAMISEYSARAQSVIVSLRKPMIERADRIIGVTSRPDKSTLVTGVKNNG
ncbi:chromosome partition protein smc [hydrocarbon metagenome]|uniref:Chromosome partition protein smc n=1 Tax=hydrocarbon metagenome TaxID=938273 RepID=A0A0W8FES7_9ZZZZ|nr:chromosome segregation protein SMC [Methanomicrobiaceae archaeon]